MANILKTFDTVADASLKTLDTSARATWKTWNGLNVVLSTNTFSVDLESGSTQWLSITDVAQTGLDITGDITIEGWFKIENAPALNANYGMISKWETTPNKSFSLLYQATATPKFRFFISSDGTNSEEYNVNQTLTAGTWFHVAVTWDASASTAKFYVNGTQTGGNQVNAFNAIANTGAVFNIGNQGGGAFSFDGLIDEVRVWDDVRTQTEIDDNKSVQLTGAEANLQSNWRFNNDLTDETANANTLTNNNAAVFDADTPF